MAAKMTAEVVWQPSAEDGNAAMVVVAAKTSAEGGWAEGGQRAAEETAVTVVASKKSHPIQRRIQRQLGWEQLLLYLLNK